MERANQTREYYDQQYAVMKMQWPNGGSQQGKEKKKKDEGDYENSLQRLRKNRDWRRICIK